MNKAKFIDHTFLKAGARKKDIDKLINQAQEYNFRTICVNSSWVKYASSKLMGTEIGITSVVGFPLGAMITQAKAHEAKLAVDHGATEIDMVMQIGKLKDHEYEYVLNDINKVKDAIGQKVLKVIIETALLNEQEIRKAAEIILKSKADFVKTSTGFSFRGASFDDIKIIKEVVGDKKDIKAAGGIKSLDDFDQMLKLGATRIGTSSGVALLQNRKNEKGY